jgi:hypothetical protein
MKLKQVLLARSIRQVSIVGTGEPRSDAIERVKNRYGFKKAPERVADLLPENPLAAMQAMMFQEGVFVSNQKRIGIALLQFLPGMIVADTRATTDDTDHFLDDYIASANARHADAITSTGPSYYLSQIEVKMERPQGLWEGFTRYDDTAQAIDRLLSGYGLTVPKYSFWGVNLNTNPHNLGVLPPAFFNIERRNGFAFESNTFFSQAPLKTKDHIALLEKLDSVVH